MNHSTLPVFAGLLLLACGSAQAVTCLNNLPPSNPDSVYDDNGDGTVTDLRSGLMWKQCVEGASDPSCSSGTASAMAWVAAQAAAQSATFAGYSDWRVPNVRELQSLMEDCANNPAINTAYFPNDPSSYVWSGSPYVDSSSFAWVGSFGSGYVIFDNRANDYLVRLVRSGQPIGVLIFSSGFEDTN